MRSAETCGLGELATQLNEGLLLVTEWNGFLGAQTGLLGGFGKISASITSIPKLKLILKRKFWFYFGCGNVFFFSLLSLLLAFSRKKKEIYCGWKVFKDAIFPIRPNWPESDIKHCSLRRFWERTELEITASMPVCWLPVPAKEKIPKRSNKDGKYGTVVFYPGWTGAVTHQTTGMSSAQFAAGHVFYQHFPPCCFHAFLPITLLFSHWERFGTVHPCVITETHQRARPVSRIFQTGGPFCLQPAEACVSAGAYACLHSPILQPKLTPLQGSRREECTPTVHPPLLFPSRGAGMEAPLWKATKPQASELSVFYPSLYLLTLHSFFLSVSSCEVCLQQ